MRCPRCTLSELSDAAATCWLCGYSGATVAVAEAPTREPSELDARRELAAEFRIDSLLERPPGPIVYLARDADERVRSEEHTSELQSPCNLVCRLLLEKKKKIAHSPALLAHRPA